MSNVIQFKRPAAEDNTSASAEYLRELADMCERGEVGDLAVFFSVDDGGEPLYKFHHLLGYVSSIFYAMEAAKHWWIEENVE